MFRNLLTAAAALFAGAPASAQVTPRPEVLIAAFEEAFVGEAADERYPVRTIRLGDVDLPSGQVVVADPFIVRGSDQPLALRFPPGRYPVDLAVADTGKGGRRVALARLRLSETPPVRWDLAVTKDEDVRTLKGDDIFGYGVDAGTGAFMDAGSVAWLGTLAPDAQAALTDDWQTRGEAHGPELGVPYGFALVTAAGPGGVAMFSSGWGDGFYASWVGYDAAGRPAAIVTDFAVITAVDIPSKSRRR